MATNRTATPEPRSTPLEAGDPVEQPALSQTGGTFAERQAARKKASRKQVASEETEDKAVTSAQTKKRAAKKG